MEIVKNIFAWIWGNIFDIALVAVGASAFVTYYWQKSNEKRAAATLILDQIDSIEQVVQRLKEEYHHNSNELDNQAVYLSKEITYSGAWDKYQYLMVRMLSQSELDLVQAFLHLRTKLKKPEQTSYIHLSWDGNTNHLLGVSLLPSLWIQLTKRKKKKKRNL